MACRNVQIAACFGLSLSSLALAQSSPVDCLAAADGQLGGATLKVSHADPATSVSATLPFRPLSFFVADGYAVKIFADPLFRGVGQMVGTADDVTHSDQPYYPLKAAAGGHWFDLGSTDLARTGVGSFACVPAGERWSEVAVFQEHGGPVAFFPGATFATTGHTYHAGEAAIRIGEEGGRKLVHFHRSHYLSPSADGTLDLDSGVLHVVRRQALAPFAVVSEQTLQPDPAVGGGVDFAYVGALTMLADIISVTLKNPAGAGPGSTPVTLPNLELSSLLGAVKSRAIGL